MISEQSILATPITDGVRVQIWIVERRGEWIAHCPNYDLTYRSLTEKHAVDQCVHHVAQLFNHGRQPQPAGDAPSGVKVRKLKMKTVKS